MPHQVLARKWRPKSFKEVIGQEDISTALKNALKNDRVAHAYIFSGIRGVGKTTTARIFAKSLNCKNIAKNKHNPCNKCHSCLQIDESADFDVLEIDAATFSKVDQIRDLTESLNYSPASGKYKILIIDEVHRLSRQAFDALLKIIEEPPSYVVFILATTSLESVPETILSRCQKFHFRNISYSKINSLLEEVSSSEGIKIDHEALRLISRASEGSVRDSLSILEQLANFSNKNIDHKSVRDIIGVLETSIFREMLKWILEGRREEISRKIRDIANQGTDLYHFYNQFLNYIMCCIHVLLGVQHEYTELSEEEENSIIKDFNKKNLENILRVASLLTSKEEILKHGSFPKYSLEITLLTASEIRSLNQVENYIKKNVAKVVLKKQTVSAAPKPVDNSNSEIPLSRFMSEVFEGEIIGTEKVG